MEKFIELVRTGKIKGPQQNAFELSKWKAGYSKLNNADETDKSLYEAGLWFDQEFQRVRKTTQEATALLQVKDPKKMLIGIATREWIVVRGKIDALLKSQNKADPVCIQELLQSPIKSIFGANISPQGIIDCLVDSIRFPLSSRFPSPDLSSDFEPKHAVETSRIIFLMGQLYQILEQLWLELVWGDYRFEENDQSVQIKPSNNSLHLVEAVSTYRRQANLFETVQVAKEVWNFQLPDDFKKMELKKRKLFTIIKKPSGKIRVKVSEALRYEENPDSAPISLIFLTHEYIDDFVKQSFPEFCNLQLKQVIAAFDLLSQIPKQMLKVLPPDSGISTVEGAMRYAPVFDIDEILNAFRNALGISSDQARFLVGFMTHAGNVREQLWFKPIIMLPDGKVSMLLPAIDGVHFFRLVDRLLKEIPNAETEMGVLYEKYLRRKLLAAASEFKFAPDLKIYSKALKFSVSDTEFEEIDLAFAVGNKIFIGEAKASLYPVDPLEKFHNVENLKTVAVVQALRKVAFVQRHLSEFLAQVEFSIDSKSAEVYPLVVTNNHLYCGYPISGVPICDILILSRYFDKGMHESFVVKDERGKQISSEIEFFYKTRSEAVDNFFEYLKHPPQVRCFEKYLFLDKRPLPTANDRKEASFCELEVRPDYDAVKLSISNKQTMPSNR